MINTEGGNQKPLTSVSERFRKIYITLRDRIGLLEYVPGTRLSEEELAREFSISRTPIRRVLARLEAEGLIEARHGVGTIVTDIHMDKLIHVFQLRMELAVLIGRLSPILRSEQDLSRIRALLTRCDALFEDTEVKAFARLNLDFYSEVSKMIGNAALREIDERLYFQTTRIWVQLVPSLNLRDELEVFRREMVDILAAAEIGDLEAIGHIRRSHISMSFTRLARYVHGGRAA